MGGRSIAAAVALVGVVTGWLAPAAAAQDRDEQPSPPDASCVVEVTQNRTLGADAPCGVLVRGDDITLDLGGHVAHGVTVIGTRVTVRNGVVTDESFMGDDNVVDGVTFRDVDGFALASGCGLTVRNSRFENNAYGIDHYFCEELDLRTSSFVGNGVALSVVGAGRVLANNNRFIANDIGVNIRDELGSTSDDVVLKRNRFERNEIGVFVGSFAIGEDTWLLRNDFVRNTSSGVVVELVCDLQPDCARGMRIDDNRFIGNGRDPLTGRQISDADLDYVADDGLTIVSPSGLAANVRVSRNVTVNNADLGIDAPGVTDGRGNRARTNGDPAQCLGVRCRP